MNYFIVDSILSGIVCCIAMDVWQRILFLAYKIPTTNWAIAGRWLIMLINKQIIINKNLDNEAKIKYELQIGWCFHYIVGIGYGFTYYFCILIFNFFDTSIISGFMFGLLSIVIPWFFFLPATGKGMMGNKTPNPNLTKLLSILSHIVVGLFLSLSFSALGY